MTKLETYVWKDKRLTSDRSEKQVEYRLIDMDEHSLNLMYKQCKEMLYNIDPNKLGRIHVLEQISQQINDCGAELSLRWFKNLRDSAGNPIYSEHNLLSDIKDWISSIKDYKPSDNYKLKDFLEVPAEFKNVTIESLIKACKQSLGAFDHSKITLNFLYNLGIFFTQKELKDLDKHTSTNSISEKLSVIKLQLGIKDDVNIKISATGLTEQEFRDMIHLKKMKGFKKCLYTDLSTNQLKTLRNKVLYALDTKVTKQIDTWNTLMEQIEEVAEYKNYNLI